MDAMENTEGGDYQGRGEHGAERRGNWRGYCGGCASIFLTHYFWTRGMCERTGNDFRTPAEVNKKNAIWCKKM